MTPIEAFRRDGYCSPEHFAILDAAIRALEVELSGLKAPNGIVQAGETLLGYIKTHGETPHATWLRLEAAGKLISCQQPGLGPCRTPDFPCMKHMIADLKTKLVEAENDLQVILKHHRGDDLWELYQERAKARHIHGVDRL